MVALHCFREAAKHMSSIKTSTKTTLHGYSTPTNLLQSLRPRYCSKMDTTRKGAIYHIQLSTWKNAVHSDNEALRKPKDLRAMAINRLKRSMKVSARYLIKRIPGVGTSSCRTRQHEGRFDSFWWSRCIADYSLLQLWGGAIAMCLFLFREEGLILAPQESKLSWILV